VGGKGERVKRTSLCTEKGGLNKYASKKVPGFENRKPTLDWGNNRKREVGTRFFGYGKKGRGSKKL